MLKRVVHSLGRVEHREKGSRRKNHQSERVPSPELYSKSRDFVVRITHAGGHQELYRHAVPASKLMTKYPGMCVARPEVFKVPHQSVLWREEVLVPGHKYILISFKDVEKLKRKISEGSPKDRVKAANGVAGHETLDTIINGGKSHRENGKMKEPNGVAGQGLEKRTSLSPKGQGSNSVVKEGMGLGVEKVESNVDGCLGEGGVEDCFYSAKDFYGRREKSITPRPSRRKGIKGKKPFVAPLPKPRPYRTLGWQPSLPTVKELSP
ncbi:hypothetical protein LR48_Vigan01g126600 [Vigna angularis]|uniref:Uncharacterized protein n=1 Tax=Phaseolus angularis TaxID=3914 RepID=A0A0L9TMM5_PHAAN|nr:uncharacterized protein LOC128194913 [Vigna angularis]KAG2409345.1 uncharacterized protein HKW66_Vig0000100 [Vigna angularis]KOM31711.1 hypothetical protein LR48_Vigan01g126600 [Vigna angularis]